MIGSTGRNTGKTLFACKLLEQYTEKYDITGVKVVTIDPERGNCPRGGKGCGVCTSLEGEFEITEETGLNPSKDTCRMLLAGATRVYFLKVRNDALEKGAQALMNVVPRNSMVVCESNSLRKVVDPGRFIVIKNSDEEVIKESCAEVISLANKVIEYRNGKWDLDPSRIHIKNNSWAIREKATAIVLAGGKSKRMGSDKSLLKIRGKTMVELIVSQLEGHFDEIIVGSGVSGKHSLPECRVVPDREAGKGPLMGMLSCLSASRNEVNFVTACDIPEINIKLINKMINHAGDADIVMPVTKGCKYEPMFAVYRKSVTMSIGQILNKGGRRIIELLEHNKSLLIDFDGKDWYYNINSREDLEKYLQKTDAKKIRAESK